MYTSGEGLQWYDPALLFPSCPLGGGAGRDNEGSIESGQRNCVSSSFPYPTQRDVNARDRGGDLAFLSPSALSHHVQCRAREMLLDRLSAETLTSDRDACASAAALLKSLHKGEPVQLRTSTATASTTNPNASSRNQQARFRGHSNPLTDPIQRRTATPSSFPASLSDGTSQSDLQRHRGHRRGGDGNGAQSPMHLLGTGDAGEEFNELLSGDSDYQESFFGEDGLKGYNEGYDENDDNDVLPPGGSWLGLRRNGACSEETAKAARHARELRTYFLSLPPQLGVQEEPVLCPLNLQTDPLAHVVAAAEVFAVVTANVPQVLYVFDQLNNLPISSTLLGGSSYAASGSGVAEGDMSGGTPFAGKQRSFGNPTRVAYTQHSGASSLSSSSVRVVCCAIEVRDTVRQLWMDPSGHYCVLAFASGKCVYYYLPRRPSAVGSSGLEDIATSGTKPPNGRENGEGEAEGSDADCDDSPEVKRRRRQERQKEWKRAARRWLRFSRRRHASDAGEEADGAENVDDANGVHDSDAAYRPRGFSLTFALPQPSSTTNAGTGTRTNTNPTEDSGVFELSCVGWSQDIASNVPGGTTNAASLTTTAVHHSPMKSCVRPSTTSYETSEQLALNMDTTSSTPSTSSSPSYAAVEVLLGARQGGHLLACLLTPTGAVEGRVVFTFPAPIAQASIDSIAAVSAPPTSLSGSGVESHKDEGGVSIHNDANKKTSSAGGVSPSSPRHVRWNLDPSLTSNPGREDGYRAAFLFPTYTHTSHFLSADEKQRNEAGELLPFTLSSTTAPASATGIPREDDARALTNRRRHRRWVVLVSVRNRLYVFSTPSSTTDLSALEEIFAASQAAGTGAVRSVIEATASRLTGRVEDAFLTYIDYPHDERWDDADMRSPNSDQHQRLWSSPLSANMLCNHITLEPSAFSEYSCVGYGSGASQVLTALPDMMTVAQTSVRYKEGPQNRTSARAAGKKKRPAGEMRGGGAVPSQPRKSSTGNEVGITSTAAPFLLESNTRGTLHLVLPPSCNSTGDDAAMPASRLNSPSVTCSPHNDESSGNDLVTPATLPPVFYWQYGDVVVHGLILCGAGGLEVGSKVRELVVHHNMKTLLGAAATTTADSATHSSWTRQGEVLPVDVPRTTSRASGLEAGLTAMVEEALRDTQDLNTLVEETVATTSDNADEVGGQEHCASLRPPSPPFTTTVKGSAGNPSVDAAALQRKARRTSSSTPPAVLPIGLLSVINLNSCLQSLRGLLAVVAASSRCKEQGPEQGHGDRPRGLTYTCHAFRTTNNVVEQGGGGPVGLDAKEGETAALLQASVTAALQHPLFQFPWTTRLQLQSFKGKSACKEAGMRDNPDNRRHRHHKGHFSPVQFTSFTSQLATLKNGGSNEATFARDKVFGIGNEDAAPQSDALLGPAFDFPLLSGALARGDVSAKTLRQLCAVVHAYIRRSPLLFDTPVETVLQNSATTAAVVVPRITLQEGATAYDSATDVVLTTSIGGCSAPPTGVHSHSSSIGQGMQRARSTMSSVDVREGRGGENFFFSNASVKADNNNTGGQLTNAGLPRSQRASPASTAPASPKSEADGVKLDLHGELLVSMAASYSHLAFTTTQGVYVVAHAAVLPLLEAALLWRRELVYHAVTTRPSSITGDDSTSTPLFIVMADPTAADTFFLASRSRMMRLQTFSLRSSAAGRKLFVMQLLTKAATAAAQHSDAGQRRKNTDNKMVVEGDAVDTSVGRKIEVMMAEAMEKASPTLSAATESVVVPSFLSYEVRLKGWLKSKFEATVPEVGQRQENEADSDVITNEDYATRISGGTGQQWQRHHSSGAGTRSHRDDESVLWQSLAPLHSSSDPLRYVLQSTAGTSTGGARSEAQSVDPSPLSIDYVARMGGDLEQPTLDATTGTSSGVAMPSASIRHSLEVNEGQLPRAQNITVVEQLRAPVGAAQHFLRHAHRQAPLPTKSSAASLMHNDSFDFPLPSSPYGAQNVETQTCLPSVVATSPKFPLHSPSALQSAQSSVVPPGSAVGVRKDGVTTSCDFGYGSLLNVAVAPSLQSRPSDRFTYFVSPLGQTQNTEVQLAAATFHQPHPRKEPSTLSSNTTTAVDAVGAVSHADDRDVVLFLSENPLLHLLLQRSNAASQGSTHALRPEKLSSADATHMTGLTRAVNIPGFGVLPGSAGLTPLTHATTRAAACLLLQKPIGADYYCVDHLYELALAAATCAVHSSAPSLPASTSRRAVVTHEDVTLLHLIRHAYGGFLCSQRRFLEAAVQFGKAADGPTPFTTVFMELVRGFREDDSLEPLALFLQLRLRALEESEQGLGGHGVEVSVLATCMLSLRLEQCSIARAQLRRYETGIQEAPIELSEDSGEGTLGNRASHLPHRGDTTATASLLSPPSSSDFVRTAWIRHRYHLDHPFALLEDALLRYGRFVDATVLSTSVSRLASANEAILVSELQGSPEQTVMSLVLREQNYFAGLLRLQALLVDPTSQSAPTHQLLRSLICAEDAAYISTDALPSHNSNNSSHRERRRDSLTAAGTMPLETVFYGHPASTPLSGEATANAASTLSVLPLPAPLDPVGLPRSLATLFERFSTLFLGCYPCRFVQEGLQVLLHQRQDIPLPPRRLLPALLSYALANNESVFEARENPHVVLRALAMARSAQPRQQRRPVIDTTNCVMEQEKYGAKKQEARRTDQRCARKRREAEPPKPLQKMEKSAAVHEEEKKVDVANLNEGSHEGKLWSTEESRIKGATMLPTSTPKAKPLPSDHVVDASLPPSTATAASSSSSTSLSLLVSRNVSHREAVAYHPSNKSLMDRAEPQTSPSLPLNELDESGGSIEYDDIKLDDSTSEERDVDEDVVLPDARLPSISTLQVLQRNSSHTTAISSSSFSSSRRKVRKSGLSVGSVLREVRGRNAEVDEDREEERENGLLPSSDRRKRNSSEDDNSPATPVKTSTPSSVTARAWSCNNHGSQNEATRVSLNVSQDATEPPAAAVTGAPLSSSSSSYSSTTSFTDELDELLATSQFSSTHSTDANGKAGFDEEDDKDDDVGYGDSGMEEFSPLMEIHRGDDSGVGAGADFGFYTDDDDRIEAQLRRARQRRNAAALQLRHVLTPTLTTAIVAAAGGHFHRGREAEEGKKVQECHPRTVRNELEFLPQHAVLSYLEDLVFHQGGNASGLDDADVAIFITYVNFLARDGEDGALQRFTEQAALQYTRKADAVEASSLSTTSSSGDDSRTVSKYRLLHVLRLCATHRRWVGCAWMYYALGYYREAVMLALRRVPGEEGVGLAVRLLGLLHERDCRRGQAGLRREANAGALRAAIATSASEDARGDYAQRQEVRWSRRDLWMLVARYLIHNGGDTKHGAQTALQLSLRNGGENFNVTDLLPELPDSLFMAELKEELLSSVRELSHKMRRLRSKTAALGRDTRILHRELQAISNQPLSMQVDERCVLCGQPTLTRPFTVYPRCRHLIHTSCYHHARQAMLRRGGQGEEEKQRRPTLSASTFSPPHPMLPPNVSMYNGADGHDGNNTHASSPLSQNKITVTRGPLGSTLTTEPPADSMECLLCARRYLRLMLDAPLHVSLVGDDVRLSSHSVLLR